MLIQPQTFPCTNCNEIINDTMEKCRYCSATVDREVAAAAAHIQSKVNQACSDASYLKTAAILMWVFLGLSFIPLIPIVGWGFLFMFIAVPVMLIRWHIKFANLRTKDLDYPRAKRSWNLALVLWLLAIPAGFVIRPMLYAIVFS